MRKSAKIKLAVLLAGLGVVGAASFAAYTVQNTRKVQRAAEAGVEGMRLYEAGEYERALPLLSTYVSQNREDVDALVAFADSRRRVPQPNASHLRFATRLAGEAVLVDPGNMRARDLQLELLADTGMLTELIEAARETIRRDPTHHRANEMLVDALTVAGRNREALEAARAYAERFPDELRPRLRVLMAMNASDVPEPELEEYLDELRERFEGKPELVLIDASRMLAASRFEEAIARADSVNPAEFETTDQVRGFIRLQDSLARYRPADGRSRLRFTEDVIDEAVETLENPSDIALFGVARAWGLIDNEQAARRLDALLAGDDSGAGAEAIGWAAFMIASGDVRADRFPSARADLEKLQGQAAREWKALVQAAEQLEAARPTEARRTLQTIEPQGDKRAISVYLLARAEAMLGEQSAAIRSLTQIFREPEWRRARGLLASIHLDRGDFRTGVEVVDRDPDPDSWPSGIAMLYEARITNAERSGVGLDDDGSTIESLEALLGNNPNNAVLIGWLARAMLLDERYERAVHFAERLIEVEADANIMLSVARRLGPADEQLAARLSAEAVRRAPGDARSLLRAALTEAAFGRVEQGETMIRTALQRAEGREQLELEISLGAFLDDVGDPRAASYWFELAERRQNEPAVVLQALESSRVWAEPERTEVLIQRLRDASGDGAVTWRIFDARRRLAASPSASELNQIIISLSNVLRTDPANTRALALTAEAHEQAGNTDAAITTVRNAVAAGAPGEARITLIELLLRAGRLEEADRELVLLAEITRADRGFLMRRAEIYESRGMLQEALQDRRRLARSGEPADMIALALSQARVGDSEGVLKTVDAIQREGRVDESLVPLIARLLSESGREAEAIALIETIEGGSGELARARFLAGGGRFQEAADLAKAVTENEPENIQAWMMLIRASVAATRFEDALSHAESAARRHADNAELGRIVTILRGADAAEASVGNLARLAVASPLFVGGEGSPEAEGLTRLAAEAVRRSAGLDSFIADLRGFARQNQRFYAGWRLLFEALGEAGRFDEAIELAREAERWMPYDFRPSRDLARFARATGRGEDALAAADRWQRRGGNAFEIAIFSSVLDLQRGAGRNALDRLTPYAEQIRQGGNRDSLAIYASALAATGDLQAAGAIIWPRVERDSGWFNVAVGVGEAIEPSRAEARRAWLTRLIGFVGEDPEKLGPVMGYAYDTAIATNQASDIEAAETLARRNNAASPGRPGPMLVLASLAELRQDAADAEMWYRELLRLEPDNPVALNNLAYVLVRQPARAADALPLAERADRNATEAGFPPQVLASIRHTHGLALLRNGDPAKAREVLESGLRHNEGMADLQLSLAETLLELDEAEQAIGYLEALEGRPDLSTAQTERLSSLQSRAR